MKIQIFGITISTAKRIKKKLIQGISLGKNISTPLEFGYVLGVYDSRILGICVYRNNMNTPNKKS